MQNLAHTFINRDSYLFKKQIGINRDSNLFRSDLVMQIRESCSVPRWTLDLLADYILKLEKRKGMAKAKCNAIGLSGASRDLYGKSRYLRK